MNNTFNYKERTYEFGTLSATEGIRVQVMILRALGEPLFKAVVAAQSSGDEGDSSMAQVGAVAVGSLASKLDADEVIFLLETLFKYTRCDKQRVDLNHFQGKTLEMWQVAVRSLQWNFRDFFEGDLFSSLASKVKSKLSE